MMGSGKMISKGKGLHIGQSLMVPEILRTIQDPFSQELIELWDNRELEGKIYTLWDNGDLVGYILVELTGKKCTIRGFYIISDFRGKGYGTGFLNSVCRILETNENRGPIIVNITSGAEKVYELTNFNILGTRKDFPDQKLAFRGNLTDLEKEELMKKVKKC